jgi:pimeloyl-ACP methyl ester carboxylesterase
MMVVASLRHLLASGVRRRRGELCRPVRRPFTDAFGKGIVMKFVSSAMLRIGAVALAVGVWALRRKAAVVSRYYAETPGPTRPREREEQPAPTPIWREPLVAAEWVQLRMSPAYHGDHVERGHGAAVVVVPGFLMNDWYLAELRSWLARIGYRPYRSGVGWNAECFDVLTDRLFATIEDAYATTGGRVHLIGHSLGGILARSAATRRPERVASVTTLASPFRGLHSHPLLLGIARRLRRNP